MPITGCFHCETQSVDTDTWYCTECEEYLPDRDDIVFRCNHCDNEINGLTENMCGDCYIQEMGYYVEDDLFIDEMITDLTIKS